MSDYQPRAQYQPGQYQPGNQGGWPAQPPAGDPAGYGQAVAAKLFPDVLPYVVGTPAVYGFTGFNGRTMADNAPEAMLSLVTNSPVPSGLNPATTQDQRTGTFPYVVPA